MWGRFPDYSSAGRIAVALTDGGVGAKAETDRKGRIGIHFIFAGNYGTSTRSGAKQPFRPGEQCPVRRRNEKHWRMPTMRQYGCGTAQRLSVQQSRLPFCVMAAKSFLCRKEKGTDCRYSVIASERRTGICKRAVFSQNRKNLWRSHCTGWFGRTVC